MNPQPGFEDETWVQGIDPNQETPTNNLESDSSPRVKGNKKPQPGKVCPNTMADQLSQSIEEAVIESFSLKKESIWKQDPQMGMWSSEKEENLIKTISYN